MKSVFYNFFFRQFRASLFPGKIPVSQVDHELDKKIPFIPDWVSIYHSFTPFWIRSIGFLLREDRERAVDAVRDFLDSMGALYRFAAEVYQKNLSTTVRPFYIRRPGFIMIHAFDPHLMCIPSLHVMVVIRTYTKFAAMIRALGEGETYAAQLTELKKGAQDITKSILYVKQHSINCVAAGMYAMTCFEPALFPPPEAEDFVSRLFAEPEPGERPPAADPMTDGASSLLRFAHSNPQKSPSGDFLPCKLPKEPDNRGFFAASSAKNPQVRQAPREAECVKIRNHIEDLYRHFLSARPLGDEKAASWDTPLIDFLRSRQR